MKIDFLLFKDKKKEALTKKQEFSSPSLQPLLRCQTYTFLPMYSLHIDKH